MFFSAFNPLVPVYLVHASVRARETLEGLRSKAFVSRALGGTCLVLIVRVFVYNPVPFKVSLRIASAASACGGDCHVHVGLLHG
jgi:hypothetical protein